MNAKITPMTTNCNNTNGEVFAASAQELQQEQAFAALAKALAHPARLRILKILFTLDSLGGCLNSDLVSELGLAQSTVSEHLRILKEAQFITAQPMPPKMCYRINSTALSNYKHLFTDIFS